MAHAGPEASHHLTATTPPRSLANNSHLNYDDPNAYVEDRKAKEKGQKRAPAPAKKTKAKSEL